MSLFGDEPLGASGEAVAGPRICRACGGTIVPSATACYHCGAANPDDPTARRVNPPAAPPAAAPPRPPAPPAPALHKRPRYEYGTDTNVNHLGRDEPAAELMARWARDGWRLVNVVQTVDFSGRGRGLQFFFEREVPGDGT